MSEKSVLENTNRLFVALENRAYTENGSLAVKSTKNPLIDLFGTIGAGRNLDEDELFNIFMDSYKYDKESTIRTLFYARDCRGGMGEKKVFKDIICRFAKTNPNVIIRNFSKIVEVGSWKDLIDIFFMMYEYKEMNTANIISTHIAYQLIADINNMKEGKSVSLLAKWLPTINSRSFNTQMKAYTLVGFMRSCKFDFITYENYRTMCRDLRKYINITETHIASKEFNKIEYSKVASKCMLLNRDRFLLEDGKRFKEYIESVKKGEQKINSKVLFPADIIKNYLVDGLGKYGVCKQKLDEVLEEQWKALPNYMSKPLNAIAVVDTSGSMYGTPLDVALSLGIYISERNPSDIYRNKMITFSDKPQYINYEDCKTLLDKLKMTKGIVANTDIERVFNLILTTAKTNNLEQSELPQYVFILSDMEFDQGVCENDVETLMVSIRKKYEEKGYQLPQLIYWNIESRTKLFPEVSRDGILFVSGYSPSLLTNMFDEDLLNPVNFIKRTLYVERYDGIVCE